MAESRGQYSPRGVKVVDVHINLDQELIQITEDKLRLILKDYLETVATSGGWVAPLGILISIVITFCTAKFDSFAGFGSEFWKSLFFLVGIGSFIWLIIALKKGMCAMTIEQFVDKVKNRSNTSASVTPRI